MSSTILHLAFHPLLRKTHFLAFVGTAFLGRPPRRKEGHPVACGSASAVGASDLSPARQGWVIRRANAERQRRDTTQRTSSRGIGGFQPPRSASPPSEMGPLGPEISLPLLRNSKRKTANCTLHFSLPRVIISGRSTPTLHACLNSLVLRHCYYDPRPGPPYMGLGPLGEG